MYIKLSKYKTCFNSIVNKFLYINYNFYNNKTCVIALNSLCTYISIRLSYI